ncbi:hypothetical protein BJ912DRAFT_133795 [Pholiota molesta]|nr:hypothetical protein BJ912DRAFT_133795 [Pholiota molesta]
MKGASLSITASRFDFTHDELLHSKYAPVADQAYRPQGLNPRASVGKSRRHHPAWGTLLQKNYVGELILTRQQSPFVPLPLFLCRQLRITTTRLFRPYSYRTPHVASSSPAGTALRPLDNPTVYVIRERTTGRQRARPSKKKARTIPQRFQHVLAPPLLPCFLSALKVMFVNVEQTSISSFSITYCPLTPRRHPTCRTLCIPLP